MGAVAVDGRGEIFMAGGLAEGSIDFGGGVRRLSSHQAFIAKFDAAGAYQWDRTYASGAVVQQLAVDPEGNLLIAGALAEGVDFAGRPRREPHYGAMFFAKLDPEGDVLWTKTWTGATTTGTLTFGVDGCGTIALTGATNQADGPALGVPGNGLFVAEYSPAGDVLWSKTYGGSFGNVLTPSIAFDAEGNLLLFGGFGTNDDGSRCYDQNGKEMPCWTCYAEPGGAQIPCAPVDFGDGTAPEQFLAKLSGTGDLVWQQAGSPTDLPFGDWPALAGVDANGNAVFSGVGNLGGQSPPGSDEDVAYQIGADGQETSRVLLPLDSTPPEDPLVVATASSGGVLAAGLPIGAAGLGASGPWIMELDWGGNLLWSGSESSNETHRATGLGFDAAGRPLVTGWVLRPTADGAPTAQASLFLMFAAP